MNETTEVADTPTEAAARAWLHSYGINTERYTSHGGDHPAMLSLPAAFDVFARKQTNLLREALEKIAEPRPTYDAHDARRFVDIALEALHCAG